MIEFKTINTESTGIIIEKKSKFIANIIPVSSKEEAENRIKDIKKKYADAKHNCYAYCVLQEESRITKSSDDGEPSGTAGMPILKVITEKNLCNVLVVVTRYFGGILLGTGGLTRAYTDSTLEAIKNADIVNKQMGYEIKLEILYADLNYFKYYIEQNKGKIININYLENIELIVDVKEKNKDEITNNTSEIGNKIQKIIKISKKHIDVNADI